jgi:hypothetical protein
MPAWIRPVFSEIWRLLNPAPLRLTFYDCTARIGHTEATEGGLNLDLWVLSALTRSNLKYTKHEYNWNLATNTTKQHIRQILMPCQFRPNGGIPPLRSDVALIFTLNQNR